MAESPNAADRRRSRSEIALTGSRSLDRNSFVPLYFQLAEILKERLETGEWPSRARFPSEREIGEQFGVSRTVIRPALDLLVGDGSIVRIKGSGTFVAPAKLQVPVSGLVKALAERLDGLTITVLSARERAPDRTVAQWLQLEGRRSAVVHVTALINVDAQPVCLVDSYAAGAQVPWLLAAARALQERTSAPVTDGPNLTRATIFIECAFFGPWAASQLGVAVGDPTLMGRLVQYAALGGAEPERPVEFARLIYRSDSTQLALELE
jgi:DNA-binding GntR family transcriptional regulator